MSDEPQSLSLEEFSERYVKPAMDKLLGMVKDGEPLSPDHVQLLDSLDPNWRFLRGVHLLPPNCS